MLGCKLFTTLAVAIAGIGPLRRRIGTRTSRPAPVSRLFVHSLPVGKGLLYSLAKSLKAGGSRVVHVVVDMPIKCAALAA
jgi:hypothetical protein